ncbi:YqaJ domain-containing protein [Aphis craccivora]|uniref:YqaJ domain-containing protein n=1 Tax=Aphis craccivora TaxID=307492 RepID=A0A6G0VT73_APHCR|nr:YqaJ domain-containing protein [Aphis craccivora]
MTMLLETPEPMNLGISNTSGLTDQPINVDCIIQSQLQTCGFSLVSTPCKDIIDDVNSSEVELFGISDPNVSAITDTALPIEYEDSREDDTIITKSLEGRRIVDIQHLFAQIQQSKHDKFNCSFIDMEFQNEIRKGFNSVFKFKCKICGIKSSIYSENINESKYLGFNLAVINGTLAVGIGQSQLSEFCASVEIPSLSSTSYLNNLSTVSDAVNDALFEELKKAGEEERRLAIESGNVDEQGVPMCTVIADGQWSKRSYKTKFNAFSGAVRYILIFIIQK